MASGPVAASSNICIPKSTAQVQKGQRKKRQKLEHKPDGQFHYCIAGDAAWYKQPPFPHLAAASGTETKKMSDYLDFNDT